MVINKQVLLRFGLHTLEVDCYLALLALGSGTVSEVAKRIEKGRSLVYFHLRHLKERGFIEESRRKTILRYVPKSASDILYLIQTWTDDFRSQLPLLESLQRLTQETPTIQVHESKRGFSGILREIGNLPTGSTWRIIEGKRAMLGEMALIPQAEYDQWFRRIIDRKHKTKAIFTNESLTVLHDALTPTNQELLKKRTWDLRVVSERNLPFQDILCIYGDTVAFLFPDTRLTVTVKHERIAQSLRFVFEGLFALGKPHHSPLEESSKTR